MPLLRQPLEPDDPPQEVAPLRRPDGGEEPGDALRALPLAVHAGLLVSWPLEALAAYALLAPTLAPVLVPTLVRRPRGGLSRALQRTGAALGAVLLLLVLADVARTRSRELPRSLTPLPVG